MKVTLKEYLTGWPLYFVHENIARVSTSSAKYEVPHLGSRSTVTSGASRESGGGQDGIIYSPSPPKQKDATRE